MDSRVDKNFSSVPRHAETLDTRLGIRRDDEKLQRKKQEDDEKPKSADELWEDNMVVSTHALIAFLKSLIRDSDESTQSSTPEQEKTAPEPPAPAARKTPSAGKAGAAASAYQKTYAATHREQQFSDELDKSGAKGPVIALSPDEKRRIHTLIDDVVMLSKHHIDQLVIPRSESFLQSLITAVEKAKQDNSLR